GGRPRNQRLSLTEPPRFFLDHEAVEEHAQTIGMIYSCLVAFLCLFFALLNATPAFFIKLAEMRRSVPIVFFGALPPLSGLLIQLVRLRLQALSGRLT